MSWYRIDSVGFVRSALIREGVVMRRLGFQGLGLSLLIAGTVSCAQSGTGVPASPTAPSLEFGARAASASPSSTTARLGPGASYDGSGSWHFIITRRAENELSTFEFDGTFTQDPDGNLHLTEDNTQITLTRRGSGLRIPYDMSVFESHQICNTELSGSAQIDTVTNTLRGRVRGLDSDGGDCVRMLLAN